MICPHCGQPMPILSDPEEAEAQLHRNARDTERAAALAVLPRAGTQRRLVLDAFIQVGKRGLTDHEIADVTGLYLMSAEPRRGELMRGGWVRDSGERRSTPKGGTAIVWKLTHRAAIQVGLRRPVRHKG